MCEVGIIGVDLAKMVFHLHGAASDGSVGSRRKLRRAQVLPFLAEQPRCTVAMEACASAHRARAIAESFEAGARVPEIAAALSGGR
jgi:transposase